MYVVVFKWPTSKGREGKGDGRERNGEGRVGEGRIEPPIDDSGSSRKGREGERERGELGLESPDTSFPL